MKKQNEHISIIGFLFSVAIAFWGGRMADYISAGPVEAKGEKLQQIVAHFAVALGSLDQPLPGGAAGTNLTALSNIVATLDALAENRPTPARNAELLEVASGLSRAMTHLRAVGWTNESFLGRLEQCSVATKALSESTQWEGNSLNVVLFFLTITAGFFFLIDIICIIWWYGRYIYKIQPCPTFPTHFTDFGVCAAFNIAASYWTDMRVFLTATLVGSGFLVSRFRGLYNSPEASGTDKSILSLAKNLLCFSLLVSAALLGLAFVGVTFLKVDLTHVRPMVHPFLAGMLSAIGIFLTWRFRKKIVASAEWHETRQTRFTPMELYWPGAIGRSEQVKRQIRISVRNGMRNFTQLFQTPSFTYERMGSRVHSQGDLFIQSYILALPSLKMDLSGTAPDSPVVLQPEVQSKALVVALSHWLDDLMDGREERAVLQLLEREPSLFDPREGGQNGRAEQAFDLLYAEVIERHTHNTVLNSVRHAIKGATPLPSNIPQLFAGLNRVAVGAVLFSPHLSEGDRLKWIDWHNQGLIDHALQTADPAWRADLDRTLNNTIQAGDDLGKAFLALTTKTVQELGMASEGQRVNPALGVLYSLMYAPLLYFHDIDKELDAGEMAVIEPFDVGYDGIVPWLADVRRLIETIGSKVDERHEFRLLQLEMAYRCFEGYIPRIAKDELEQSYCGANSSRAAKTIDIRTAHQQRHAS